MRFQLLSTAVGLVSLDLTLRHRSTYIPPRALHEWLSLMPQLEILQILFGFLITNRNVERNLTPKPIMTPLTLPSLHFFAFRAVSAYYKLVLGQITAHRLEVFRIRYPNPPTSSIPEILHFIGRTENFGSYSADFFFQSKYILMRVNPHDTWTERGAFSIDIRYCHFDQQVSSVAQSSNTLSQIFAPVKELTLSHAAHSLSSEEHDEVDRAEWIKLLKSFRNLKTLIIEDVLIEKLSRCLGSEDGKDLELLPELEELRYEKSRVEFYDDDDGYNDYNDDEFEFTSFIDARENAGRPVTLVNATSWD